jgi:hypothetical protein
MPYKDAETRRAHDKQKRKDPKAKGVKRLYYQEHKEELSKRNREYQINHPEKAKEYYDRYHSSDKGQETAKRYRTENREANLLAKYKYLDEKKGMKTDITVEWMRENITSKVCTYCGTDSQLGCDRIDNNRGHSQDNCIPCCFDCNRIRADQYSVEEMIRFGILKKQILRDRTI